MADIRGASNNIYTVLAFIAALVLLFGVIYVGYRYTQVIGNPFTGAQAAVAAPATNLA